MRISNQLKNLIEIPIKFFQKELRNTLKSTTMKEITVSFVSRKYPGKLFRYLETVHKYQIEKSENGIYILHGDVLPIQIIVTKELSEQENLRR